MIFKILTFFRSYFLYGLLIVLPILATFFVVYITLTFLTKPFNHLFGTELSPLFALCFSFILITIIGFLSRNVLGQFLFTRIEDLLKNVPLINQIYSSSKQIIKTFSSSKRQIKAVLIEYPKKDMWAIGFLTCSKLTDIASHKKQLENKVSIFIPTTPNPTSGYMVLLMNSLMPMDIKFDEAVKLLISARFMSK